MGYSKNKEIMRPNIIMCEGRDAVSFMIYYLEYLCKKDSRFESFQVMDFGGITELTEQLTLLIKMPQFSIVKSILIIRDAEKDYVRAKNDIAHTCNAFGVDLPSKPGMISYLNEMVAISYLLLPALDDKGETNGTLEDLCLGLIKADKHELVLCEVDKYLNIMEDAVGLRYPRIHKNKLHMMISSYDKYVDAKAGEAGQRGMYDFDSIKLEYLKDTLTNLAN